MRATVPTRSIVRSNETTEARPEASAFPTATGRGSAADVEGTRDDPKPVREALGLKEGDEVIFGHLLGVRRAR